MRSALCTANRFISRKVLWQKTHKRKSKQTHGTKITSVIIVASTKAMMNKKTRNLRQTWCCCCWWCTPLRQKITYENTLNCRRLSSYAFFPHSFTYCPILLPLLLIWCMWHKRWTSTTDGIKFIDKVNCNRIQATSTEHQHQYWYQNKPIPAITPTKMLEWKKAGKSRTTGIMGIKKANVEISQRKTWGWNFYRLLSHYGKHISPQFGNAHRTAVLVPSHIRLVVDFFAENVVSTFQSFVCYLVVRIFFCYFLFGFFFPRIRLEVFVCGKESEWGDKWKKTIELCKSLCVAQSKYFKSIIAISLEVVFFLVRSIYLSFRPLFSNCYLKSVFYFSYDFLLNLFRIW